MKLSAWAKLNGIPYKTAWKWFRAGILPAPARQLPTGIILVDPPQTVGPAQVALYGRVSSSDQKEDRERQIDRLSRYAAEHGLVVPTSAAEVGSARNGHRPKLLKSLAGTTSTTIVVAHRERLMRFGFEYLEAVLAATGRSIIVIEPIGIAADLVRDMTEVLTSFCARL
jgi:putative resolvase